ncbi:MAG: carbohydrate binding family 9 domain-containing protein [Microscillaceae bacterium]|nr:carbohydrate binding family 9 domain-containing protein [Microscillaceae bacterium]MDW8459964.1 DUF5916 domain-containing protein [Cytophagales bacterium]
MLQYCKRKSLTKEVIGLFVTIFFNFQAISMAQQAKFYQIEAPRSEEKIELDGELSEEIWKKALKAQDFYQNFPFDTSYAVAKTEAYITYDEHFIYVGAICYEKDTKNFTIQSLRRDFDPSANDFFIVYFDTFQDQLNGFAFGVSPFNVQREGLITDGGRVDTDWDNKWYSQTKIYADRWLVEMAIPFKTLRFKGGSQQWKVNFGRRSMQLNEVSSWVPVPRVFSTSTLAFTGDLFFETPLKHTGTNISLIPFAAGNISNNFLANTGQKSNISTGLDAKIALTSSLNLDLTVNPDFSQVEVDNQVTNLSRFELFFPERRQFFLENSDLFGRFGFSRIRPFFSRRIGLAYDTVLKQTIATPILYGARLSGKANKDWRVGFLNMQTSPKRESGILGQNYTAAVFQRQVFTRSNIAGIFVNRQATSNATNDFIWDSQNYNRIAGIDYNLASKDNKWSGKLFYHQSFSPNQPKEAYAHASYIGYNTQSFYLLWNHEYVGQNYRADVGFVPRRNLWRLEPIIGFRFFSKKPNSKLNNQSLRFYNNLYWQTNGKLTDRSTELNYEFEFNNTQFLGFYLGQEYVYLFSPFDPTNTGGVELPSNTAYNNRSFYAYFQSDIRKRFNYSVQLGKQTYFSGKLRNWEQRISYRFQPFGSISLNLTYNGITLPLPYNSANLWLLGSRLDLTFTKDLFLTIFTQYNQQIDNFNINARLQWRFKPVSDLFIVYTDNYFPTNWKAKNRTLVLKLTYWFNV